MDDDRGFDHFHRNEQGDIYDLYNACNGVMSGELLDVRKLDELTPREREVLDVARLRQVWEHTATGCFTCRVIVQTLNAIRGKICQHANGPPPCEPRPATASVPCRAKGKAQGQNN